MSIQISILIFFIQISGVLSFAQENSAPSYKKPTKSEYPYNLNAISNDDVIQFFRKDKSLRKHWQKIMDTDRYNSNFQRHVNCLTTKNTGWNCKMKQETNPTFLRPPKDFDTDIITTLSCIVTEILNKHPKIGQETNDTKKNYAENVLIPEGCENFLIHKFNMSEAQAKDCYLKHHVIKCDYCDVFFYNKQSDNDKHYKKVHKASIDLENQIREILEVAYILPISERKLGTRLQKYYTKSDLSLRKKEINKLHVKVQNEIKEKKEALARELRLKNAQNHEEEEDADFLDMDF